MEYYDQLTELFEGPDGDLFRPKQKPVAKTADDRLIDSFDDIVKFAKAYGRAPDADSDDIGEATLGYRLNSIKSNKDKVDKLSEYDELGLLSSGGAPRSLDELFAHDADLFGGREGLFNYDNAPSLAKRTVTNDFTPERRKKCEDFDEKYRNLFIKQQNLLGSGLRKLTPFEHVNPQLKPGNFYVYGGQMCYVESFGEKERKAGGYSQQRIKVIFENGLESNMYRRSLAQRLYEGGSVVVDANYGADGNSGASVVGEKVTGHIYVLESLSKAPAISTIANLYKIGCTKNSVAERIVNAANEATYLMAPVKIVDDYRLTGSYNIHKVETLIHHFFADAKVDVEVIDANGKKCIPDEWYSVPISVIREAIDMIDTGEIVDYVYDSKNQSIARRGDA